MTPAGIDTALRVERVEGAGVFTIASAAAVADSDDAAGYANALAALEKTEKLYHVVPYSTDPVIVASCIAHINKMSAPEVAKLRIGWYGVDLTPQQPVYGSSSTIVGSIVSGVLTLAEGDLVTADIQAGDIVRFRPHYNSITGDYEWDERTVLSVTSPTVAGVSAATSGSPDINSDVTIVIDRVLEKAAYVSSVISKVASGNSRGRLVWGASAYWNGLAVPMSVVAAACAGLRAGAYPHQPIANTLVPGITIVDDIQLTNDQMDSMSDAGVWVIERDENGNALIWDQVTMTADTTTDRFDSVMCAADSVVRELRSITEKDRGQVNITDEYIKDLRSALNAKAGEISSRPYPNTIGRLLRDFAVLKLEKSPVNDLTLLGTFNMLFGKPLHDGVFVFNIL